MEGASLVNVQHGMKRRVPLSVGRAVALGVLLGGAVSIVASVVTLQIIGVW